MKILVAERCPVSRSMIVAALEEGGHSVAVVEEGSCVQDAVERLEPAIVLLEWRKPPVGASGSCDAIRAGGMPARSTFVIATIARDAAGDVGEALEAGVDDFLVAPFGPEQVLARVAIAHARIAQRDARHRSDEELAAAQVLARVGRSVTTVQHQINNPLAAVMAYASLAIMEPDLSPALREMLNVIVADARRIAAVVRRMGQPERRSGDYAAVAHM